MLLLLKWKKKIRHSFFKKRESSTVFVGTNDYTNIRFQTLNVREVVSKILGLNVENFQLNEYNRYQYPFLLVTVTSMFIIMIKI